MFKSEFNNYYTCPMIDRGIQGGEGMGGGGGENSESQLFDVLNDEHSDSRLFGSSIKGEKKL